MDIFTDKSVLITGGANGVGRATAELLAEAGARITIADIDRAQGPDIAKQVGGQFVECDVSTEADNREAVRVAVQAHGGLDYAVLNAGVAPWCPVGSDFETDRYRQLISVNLDGVMFGLNAAVPAMAESGGGSIIATASIAGLMGTESNPVYSATKHAVVGLVRSSAPLLEADQITVNAICPGFIDTFLVSQVRDSVQQSGIPIMQPADIADAIAEVFASEVSGSAWVIQPGVPLEPYKFRGVPGARNPDGSRINAGAAPDIAWKDSHA